MCSVWDIMPSLWLFLFFMYWRLELISEEIEDPFGFDANDLPIEKISANIKKHVEEII